MQQTSLKTTIVKLLALTVLVASALTSVHAASVGLNFTGNGSPITDAGGAFGVPLANWSNLSGGSGNATINPANGGAITVTWATGGGTWQSVPPFPGFSAGENQVFSGNLWAGQNDPGGNLAITVTISGMDSIGEGEYTLRLMAGVDGPRNGARFREAIVNGDTPLFFDAPIGATTGQSIAATTTNLTLSGDSFSFTIANDNVTEDGIRARAELSGFTLEFTPVPGPTVTQQPYSQTVAEGTDVTFTVAVAGAEPFEYQWDKDGVDLWEYSDTLSLFNVTPTEAGVYRVKITDANGRFTFSSAAQLIVAAAAPVLAYDPATIVSAGAESFGGGLANSFEVVFGTSIEISELGTVLHESALSQAITVQLFNSANKALLASVVFDAADASTPVASTPALNLFLKPLPTPLQLGAGSYAVAIFNNSASARVTRTPSVVTVNGGGAIRHLGSSYGSWEGPGNLPPVADGTGFQYLAGTFTMTVSGKPVITQQPQGGPVPPGTDVTLAVVAGGSQPLTYQWQKDGKNLDGATSSTLVLSKVGSTSTGDYQAIVANNLGSVTSLVARVEVAGTPTLEIQMHPGIVVHGVVGLHYRVEWRDALNPASAWQLLQDIPSLLEATQVIYDPAPTSANNKRFYQAVLVP